MEQLLQELLPKSISISLMSGLNVPPEVFEDVTIFFSDVVGFTRISAAGTAIDVVNMLNMMYTVFDDISAAYDVYKVATIGDAYFVASGVPVSNGDRHAAEICKMALSLLEAVSNFPIPHLPEETLKLRIGIHTGSCVAGVAGTKMPRYLLFGDTIDIASRMESNGESMKIHISPTTENLLQQNGQFNLEPRDPTYIQGLGQTQTYWLTDFITDNQN